MRYLFEIVLYWISARIWGNALRRQREENYEGFWSEVSILNRAILGKLEMCSRIILPSRTHLRGIPGYDLA